MSEATILQLLSTAEQCNERGRHKMAKLALGEIWGYIESDVGVDDQTWERIQELDSYYLDDPDYTNDRDHTSSPDAKDGDRCPKCSGTGKFGGNGRVCYACLGKGHQDDLDRARTKAYWAHRNKLQELRRNSSLGEL